MKKYLFLLCLIGFLNPAYGKSKIINNNPVPWTNEIVKGIEEDPENQWARFAQQSLSNTKNRNDNGAKFEECLEGVLFNEKRKYCILSIIKVSPGVASPIGPSGFTDRLSLARVRKKPRGRSYTFRELVEKVNWAYVCVALAPFASYYIIGLFNPVTGLPATIGAATTGLACVIVGELGTEDKMGEMRGEIIDKLNKQEEEAQRTREETQKTREETQKTREETQKQKEEIQRLKERLDRLENPPTE